MGMGIPGAFGAIKTAEKKAILDVRSKESDTISRVDTQERSTEVKIHESIEGQIKKYKEQRNGILNAVGKIKSRLNELPNIDHPQVNEARKKLEEQLSQMRDALSNINKAIDFVQQQRGTQLSQMRGQLEGQRKEIRSTFQIQIQRVLAQFAGQKAMLNQRVQMMQGSPEGGRPKG